MNWVQKTVCAQQMMNSILSEVANGNMDVTSALTQLQNMRAPAPECCSVIMSMYQTYPQGQTALDAISRELRCNDIQQTPPAPEFAPEVETPMQTPSVEIE
jgi:hypothetical protein